ncbi:MAG: hypothetical protein ACRD15_13165 [Vicinamibacterales bacterium]
MQVGVNYPWLDYGWDFGLGPPTWRGRCATPRWYSEVDRHLHHFRSLGLSVVRWFVLADGLTYGIGASAPKPESSSRCGWRFDPPPLGADFLEHFDELLGRFAATGGGGRQPVQLLPVLIDFHFCNAGFTPVEAADPADPIRAIPDCDWVKQGRAEAIIDPDRRARFLDHALEPLLRVSHHHPEVIYAWEIVNEPDWVTRGWHPSPVSNPPIPEDAMRAFLEDGKERIRRAGFKPTVGFARARTLRTSGITTDINQFHHYPGGIRTLDRHAFDPAFPGIIGEFATAATDIWPDLIATGQSMLNRLRLAESRGYPLAIPWAFLSQDRHTAWSLAVERDVRLFTGCTGER